MTPAGKAEGARGLYRLAEELTAAHWEPLLARAPEEAARAACAALDGGALVIDLLGRRLRVDPSLRAVRFLDAPAQEVGFQRALVAVGYLGGALDAPARGDWVAFRELPGGDAFFRGPHAVGTGRLERAFGARPEGLAEAAARLGGVAVPGADAAVELPALPKIPLRALVWRETPEFAARAALLTDGRAYLHLPLATLWALTNVAIADLAGAAELLP